MKIRGKMPDTVIVDETDETVTYQMEVTGLVVSLRRSAIEAWSARAEATAKMLELAERAPALFVVDRLVIDYRAEVAHAGFWRRQSPQRVA